MMETIKKTSLSTSVFGPEKQPDDLLRFLETTRQAGYEYVELSRKQFDLASRADAIRSTGVAVWSVHGCLGGDAFSCDESLRKAAVAKEIARVEDAAAFGPVPVVEHYLYRQLDPVYGRNFRRSIEELYAASHDAGVILTIETVPYKPQINERYADSAEVAAFVRSFDAEDLRITIDINHSNLHEDLFQVCANCRGLIANVHMSDNHGEWEDHLPPGEGIIDFPAVFAALRECGYTGPANLEMHAGAAPVTAAWLEKIRKYVESILFQ